jgi:hypothetical protein
MTITYLLADADGGTDLVGARGPAPKAAGRQRARLEHLLRQAGHSSRATDETARGRAGPIVGGETYTTTRTRRVFSVRWLSRSN